ncbi:hypothetical protein [Aliiglaciecola sp. LCG003]|uniref:hypothetical protein n=1 Tax=Aliiglaciecola sp. LCG003 TaxID=3053655 RepID=UPI00257278D8|nr:hypothetical protein [Aliiglaciecola sp. LCG003]WJG10356.1 hypothetical protein QR722_04780 [Aliiglaciecola sp. LCG003]
MFRKRNNFIALAFCSTLAISGCASKSKDIPATYVSPNEYASLDCPTLQAEITDISTRVNTITGQVDKEASNDSMQMGIGLVLFWPALLFLEGGDGALQADYALLKGKYEAANTQFSRKNCSTNTKQSAEAVTPVDTPKTSEQTDTTN